MMLTHVTTPSPIVAQLESQGWKQWSRFGPIVVMKFDGAGGKIVQLSNERALIEKERGVNNGN